MAASRPQAIHTASKSNATVDAGKLRENLFLLCKADSRHFALPVESVIETLRNLACETLADAPSFVLGLCVVRGEPVVVIDSGALFGEPPVMRNRLVMVRVGNRAIALTVDAIVGVRAVSAQSWAALPPLSGASDSINAITMLDQELVFLMQGARVIPEDVLDSIEAAGRK